MNNKPRADTQPPREAGASQDGYGALPHTPLPRLAKALEWAAEFSSGLKPRQVHRNARWIQEDMDVFDALSRLKQQGDLTVDHVVPVSKGGSNDIANIVPACRRCNSRKGAKLL